MIDYAQWIARAVAFTRRLQALPGCETQVHVAPPMSLQAAADLSKTLRFPLPEPLRQFMTQGSADCSCWYVYDPPAFCREKAGEILGTSHELSGGAELCKADFFDEDLRGFYDAGEALGEHGYPRERELWQNSFPFYNVGTGDALGLYRKPGCSEDQYPVVYLCFSPPPESEKEGFSGIIADSFDKFLEYWEYLHYINGGFLWRFCDTVRDKINPDSPNAKLLREVFAEILGQGTQP